MVSFLELNLLLYSPSTLFIPVPFMVIVLSLLGTLKCCVDTPIQSSVIYLTVVSAASKGMVSFEIPS